MDGPVKPGHDGVDESKPASFGIKCEAVIVLDQRRGWPGGPRPVKPGHDDVDESKPASFGIKFAASGAEVGGRPPAFAGVFRPTGQQVVQSAGGSRRPGLMHCVSMFISFSVRNGFWQEIQWGRSTGMALSP